MRMVYTWKTAAGINIDAQTVGERIDELASQNNGLVTPKVIVDDARPEQSLLHPAFEWNDIIAAEKFREDQARHIIRSVTVKYEESPDQQNPIRAFVNVISEESRGYINIATAMSQEHLKNQVLTRAWKELQDWKKRYSELSEFSKLFQAIEESVLDVA